MWLVLCLIGVVPSGDQPPHECPYCTIHFPSIDESHDLVMLFHAISRSWAGLASPGEAIYFTHFRKLAIYFLSRSLGASRFFPQLQTSE